MTTTDSGRSPDGSGYSAEPEPISAVSAVPVSIPNAVEPYENTLTVEELRREVREYWDREAAFTQDLRSLPEVPSVETMYLLSSAGMNFHGIDVWEMGKALQRKAAAMRREQGIDVFDTGNGGVPWKCEYECGAGLWLVIRNAIAMEARRVETTQIGSIEDDSAAIAQPLPSSDKERE